MNLQSARALKLEAQEKVMTPMVASVRVQSLGVPATAVERVRRPETVALGIHVVSSNDFRLAIRIQHPALRNSREVAQMVDMAKGEADVQYIGVLNKLQAIWTQQRCRPLLVGCSVGHFNVTAGTLGAFVRSRVDGSTMILSNNHVLADENTGQPGDVILQPGKYDGGQNPNDAVAQLTNFVPISFQKSNMADCAAATLISGTAFDVNQLKGWGVLSGVRSTAVATQEKVSKVGRTTDLTAGTVTAIEMDNVAVRYSHGLAHFDGQIEIEGQGQVPFSRPGDSGSLVFDSSGLGTALLFAGGDQGGSNGMGLTYASPIQNALDGLAVDLLF
jgi:hypothetical protein